MRFPTVVEVNQPIGGTTYPGATTSPGAPAGTVVMPPAAAPNAYPGAAAPSPYPGAAAVAPPASILPPPGYAPAPQSYGGAPTVGAGPTASFNGPIAPPPGWDPNAVPSNQPGSLLSQDPYMSTPQFQWPSLAPVMTMRKFIQEVRGDYTYMSGNDADRLNMHDVIVTSTFALPFFYSREHPLLITPGFGFHFLSEADTPSPPHPVLPGTLYDAFIDAEWNPQLTPWLGAELGVRVGVYSDFKQVTVDSIRYPAQGFAVLRLAPSVDLKFGVMWLDRVDIKLLPSGGVIWRPNTDNVFEILFPNPKLSHRLGSDGVTEWWLYARGEYGGGDWLVTRPLPPPGQEALQRVDYNDMRVGLGLEFKRRAGLSGLVEVGYAFERQVMYELDKPNVSFQPTSALFLRGGLAY